MESQFILSDLDYILAVLSGDINSDDFEGYGDVMRKKAKEKPKKHKK